MPVVGWFLFILGYGLFFAENLGSSNFLNCLPSIIILILAAGFLFWADWKGNKNTQKKISILALMCFIFGLMGFIPIEKASNWIYFIIGLFSVIFGVIFKLKQIKEQGRLVGNSLFVTGVILGGTTLFATFCLIALKK